MYAPASASTADPHQGLAPRRGKPPALSIKTDIPKPTSPPTDPLPAIERPPPVETVIYRTSPDRSAPPEALSGPVSRRTSKLVLRSIFGKGKTGKNGKFEGPLDSTSEDAEVSSQVSSESPFFQPPPKQPVNEKAPPAKLKSAKKERPPRPLMTWDPPPLFQAFPQALKSGTLTAPVLSAETVLRMHKDRSMYEGKTIPGPQLVADWHDYPSDEEANQQKKSHKRQPSAFVECTQKIYVLTTSGFMLQYSSEGSHDRLPERIMQLGKDSAAFASDAIPGKHWVLQISQTTSEEGPVANEARKSVFSRIGFSNGMKRPVSTYLLVMENAAEMDSWLVAMRREIQSLGGKTYRPDEALRSNSQDAMQRLRERPSRRFLIEKDPNQHSGNTSPLSPQPRVLSHRSSLMLGRSPPGHGPEKFVKRPSLTGSSHSRENFVPNLDVPALGSAGISSLGRRASSGALFPSPTSAGAKIDKALPAMPLQVPLSPINTHSPINALGIVSSEKDYNWATPVPSAQQEPQRNTLASNFSRPKHRSMMPISSYNTEMKKYDNPPMGPSESEVRQSSVGSSDSSRAPNFSVPSFSRRYPHMKQPSDDRISSGSTTTSRGRTPSLTDGESARPESIVGDLPTSVRSVQRPRFQGHAEVAIAVSMSPVRAKQVENELPELAPVRPDQIPKIPKRMSSLEYTNGVLPWNNSPDVSSSPANLRSVSCSPRPERFSSLPPEKRALATPSGTPLLQPPQPPPTSALPPLPPSVVPSPMACSALNPSLAATSPASATSATPLRRPTSTQYLNRSPRKIKPAVSMSTLKLPVAPPMTIQERRMLGRNNIADLPPPLPPPTTALPPPPTLPPSGPPPPIPGAAVVAGPKTVTVIQRQREQPASARSGAPPTPPTRETPPSLAQPSFEQDQRLPDSPPNTERLEPQTTQEISKSFIPEMRQMSPLKSGFEINNDVPRSPISESWGNYLQRLQAS